MNQGDKLYTSSHWVREKMKLNMSKRLYSKNSLGKKRKWEKNENNNFWSLKISQKHKIYKVIYNAVLKILLSETSIRCVFSTWINTVMNIYKNTYITRKYTQVCLD